MKAVFGVAGDVVPGELGPLRQHLEAEGSFVTTLQLAGLELLLVGRSHEEIGRWQITAGQRSAIVVGRPLHPTLTGGRTLLREVLADRSPNGAKRTGDWMGEFNLLVADGQRRRLEIETDCLGLRPMFLYESDGRAVFGSEVLPLAEAGLVPPQVDVEALAAWTLLEHPLNGRSLIAGLRRIDPGRVLIDLESGSARREADEFSTGGARPGREGLIERLAASVDEFLLRMLREEDRIGSFLSGGYDSRYLACRMAALGHPPDEAVLVDVGAGDLEPGREIAERLQLPLTIVEVRGGFLDAFEDPWFFAPHGFPQRRFYTSLALNGAVNPPPMVDGLLGDDGVRGWVFEQRVRQASRTPDNLNEGLLSQHYSLRPELVFDDTASSLIRDRVLAQIDAFRPADVSDEAHRAWLWVLMHRTRDFHAKNHLQVLDRTESYHPFVNRGLLKVRLQTAGDLFDERLYRMLLHESCPVLDGIPHSETLPWPDLAQDRYSERMRARTMALIRMVAGRGRVMRLRRGALLARLAAYGLGNGDQLYLLRILDRLRVADDRVAAFGIEMPWEALWNS
jgi:hypothetical protein